MICVSIGRTRHKMVVAEHKALAERGAELVEFRADWLSRIPDMGRLIKDRPTPIVFTCRRLADRGRFRGNEDQRMALLRTAIVAEVDYVDLEEDIAAKIPRFGSTKRIISYHNFDETPDDLEDIHLGMKELDPDIIKIATMANTPLDWVRMLRLVKSSDVPTIGFCMGELGLPSRILCGRYGSPFTYATFSKDRELAPGQLSFEEMRKLYRFDQITPETEIFGVLGDPIGHSLSPLLHNAAFQKLGMDAVYLPFRVPKDHLLKTLEEFEWLGVQGYSVTIPHKESVLEYADKTVGLVREMGAANTLIRGSSGQWTAANTDCEAALQTMRLGLGLQANDGGAMKGKKVLILGAGGVARAIGFGLVREGAAVTITNRTQSRASELAKDLGCQQIKWGQRASELADIIVNCTSVGMHPNVDDVPFQMNWISDGQLVFDTVYNPENTLLLKQAKEYGWSTASGLEMFVRQAAAQFEMFSGEEAPLNHLRDVLRRWISPVSYS